MKGLNFTLTFTRLWRATPLPSKKREFRKEIPKRARAHYTHKNTVSLFLAPVNRAEDTGDVLDLVSVEGKGYLKKVSP
jgi:hypothetical protein